MKKPNATYKLIWLTVLLLFVCTAATTVALANRLDVYQIDDAGAIPLVQNTSSLTDEPIKNETADETHADKLADDSSQSELPQASAPVVNPGFEAGDNTTIWETDTRVEIFKLSYVNGQQVVTVNSDDGDKLIAPGTESSYTFKLKNTGDVPIDYTLELDAYFTPDSVSVPINARLSRYDGAWIVGDNESYANISELNTAADKATLGRGKYTYYTLDWQWSFEGSDDELDTILGNLAADQDLTFTIEIKTTATESTGDGGIVPPQTGDDTALLLWVVISGVSFIILMALVLAYRSKTKRYGCTEAE